MQCSQCQHENLSDALFCEACGAQLEHICSRCQTTNRATSKFCRKCGTSLASTTAQSQQQPVTQPGPGPSSYTPQHLAEKILTSRSALQGERKQVTVMFCDIKDSTELIRDLDPEAAQQLLDPAIHIMMDAVHRFEGTVNQVLGDGIMAIFGAPIAHEDHAARACYAALAMQNAMQIHTTEVRRSHGLTLRIRVGLNAGEVVVRTIGNDLHMDYSAVGPTTHLAARMEQLADSGSIVLTASTLRLVEGFVRVNALGVVPIKGMSEPVEVYELTGASTIRRRLQAAVARGLTKFVGRDTEIEILNQALEQAKVGNGQVVAVMGEAGLGKSRLFYEFTQSHHTQGWRVLESASVSYGKATPYFPIIDLLKRYAHVEEGDDTRTIRAKLTGQVLTLDEALHEMTPALLALCDVLPDEYPFLQHDPPQRRQHTLDSLKRLLLRESQEQPLLLVFEDLHWIDSETQALLDRLIDSLPTSRMLLLVNYRPEYQHGWGSKTYYTQLRLDPLQPESADAFLAALLGNDPNLEALKKLLIERTEGNPFFLEESVRTLLETEVLIGELGGCRLAQQLPTIQVPATVQAILAARIDRLPQDEKQLLQTAAVIGNEVPLPLLQAVSKVPEEALYRGLTHLQAAEFLYETSLYPERISTFKHALTHEVAYGSLLQERRRMLHAQIVEALEALASDHINDQIERLAHHALRGEVWDKALTYLRQAGAEAMDQSAYREAAICFDQALTALQHQPEGGSLYKQAIDLRFDLRNALIPLAEHERILDRMREAEMIAKTFDDHRRLGQISGYMAQHFNNVGDYDRAIASSEHALTLAANHEDFALQVGAKQHLGIAYYGLGDYRQAIDLLDGNVSSLAEALRYEHFGRAFLPSVVSRTFLSLCLCEQGEFADGIRRGQEGMHIAETVDSLSTMAFASYGIGHVYLLRGDLQKAIVTLERARELCHIATVQVLLSPIVSALGYAYALSGRGAEALSLMDQATALGFSRSRVGSIFGLLRFVWLSGSYLLDDRIEDARSLATRTLEFARAHRGRGHEAHALHLLADIAMQCDPLEVEQAESHYQQCLALADELGMHPLQAHCHRGLGALYRQTGQSEQARAELSTAIDMYRDMGMTLWLPETEAALAEVEMR